MCGSQSACHVIIVPKIDAIASQAFPGRDHDYGDSWAMTVFSMWYTKEGTRFFGFLAASSRPDGQYFYYPDQLEDWPGYRIQTDTFESLAYHGLSRTMKSRFGLAKESVIG